MKLGIFSDCHIPPQADPRFGDYIGTLRSIVSGMIERRVDYALFGGDMALRHSVAQGVVHAFGECMKPLGEAGIPLIAIAGNHDISKNPEYPHSMSCLDWMRGFRCIDFPQIVHIPNPQSPILQILCLPYPNRNVLLAQDEYKDLGVEQANQVMHNMLADILKTMAHGLKPGVPSVLLAHLSLTTAKTGAQNSFMMGKDVCLSPHDVPGNIDHAFFGHVHKPQEVAAIHVIGSPERVDFGEEGEPKRWLLLNIDTDTGTVESIPTGCREFTTLTLDARQGAPQETWRGGLLTGAILRVRVNLRKGQDFDFAALRREMIESGAHSVQIEPQYEDETRLVIAEAPEHETHEDVMRAWCAQKGIAPDRRDAIVGQGLQVLQEASA